MSSFLAQSKAEVVRPDNQSEDGLPPEELGVGQSEKPAGKPKHARKAPRTNLPVPLKRQPSSFVPILAGFAKERPIRLSGAERGGP